MNIDRVLVLCSYYRCGSTAFCEHYSQTYNLSNNDEMFFHDADPDVVVSTLEKNSNYVLKIISDQWAKNMKPQHKEYIKEKFTQNNTQMFLLYRQNIAESLLSIAHCNHTSQWHNKENSIDRNEIDLLVNQALDKFKNEYEKNIQYANEIIDYLQPKNIVEYKDVFKLPTQKFKKSITNENYNIALNQLNKALNKQLIYNSKYFNIQ